MSDSVTVEDQAKGSFIAAIINVCESPPFDAQPTGTLRIHSVTAVSSVMCNLPPGDHVPYIWISGVKVGPRQPTLHTHSFHTCSSVVHCPSLHFVLVTTNNSDVVCLVTFGEHY